MNLQEKDIKIIEELKEDSRSSIRDIAKKTKLRPSTVHQRMQKLSSDGIIEKYTVKLNNEAMGESFIVFVLVKTHKHIEENVFQDTHIKDIFGVTGEFDLMLKCKFKDIVEFNDFIIKFRKNPAVNSTLTLVSTLSIKEEI